MKVGIHERGYPGFSVGAGESRENPRADSVKAVGSEGERERPNVETVLSCKDIPTGCPKVSVMVWTANICTVMSLYNKILLTTYPAMFVNFFEV